MTDENTQVIAALTHSFLSAYVELAERGIHPGVVLYDSNGTPVRVKHTTTHRVGCGYSEIFKNDVCVGKFDGIRGCVTRNHQGQFIQALTKALE